MRTGSFSRVTVQYGADLSVVKPERNDWGTYIIPELQDPTLQLTQQQQYDLQQRIDDLFAIMRGEGQYYK